MNNLLVKDVKSLDEQYRIGDRIISDDAFKQLEKLFMPIDPEFDYFNQKNNRHLPKLAKELSQNKIIGWFQGRMEFGPRALGARSILANPLSEN